MKDYRESIAFPVLDENDLDDLGRIGGKHHDRDVTPLHAGVLAVQV